MSKKDMYESVDYFLLAHRYEQLILMIYQWCVDVHWPRKMSELDNDNAGIVHDSQDDDNTEVADEIETSTMTAEQIGHETLRLQLGLFLELFTTEKMNLY